MASILRLSIWALFILGVPSFLVLQGSVTPVIRIAGGTTLLAWLSVLLFTGKPKQDSIAAISNLQTKTAVVNSEQKYDNEPTKIEATPTSERAQKSKKSHSITQKIKISKSLNLRLPPPQRWRKNMRSSVMLRLNLRTRLSDMSKTAGRGDLKSRKESRGRGGRH